MYLELYKNVVVLDVVLFLSVHNTDTVPHVAMFIYHAFIERELFYYGK
jgi:hypothetical protein